VVVKLPILFFFNAGARGEERKRRGKEYPNEGKARKTFHKKEESAGFLG